MTANWATGDKCELPATANHWLCDEPQPGLVLVEFVDANGRPHCLVDKSAIFGADLLPTSTYPRPTYIQCSIEEINGDIATVSPWWTTSRAGIPFLFDVRVEVLVPRTTG
ncbi:hypothetical protein GFY24_34040 [Nocardia sp. SYP-A9097]|uniref:hypothetical protein n=1 Tax=Nocardia sp. SYP-A9097 TaxID=2663237 RepID=UPI00129B4DFF|nr:hypothetical protein [Nocardia sp. SYP-A9097]MRH92388.1 hypothetical protein [Nocardia sp. SYP-A9097]